MSTTDKHNISNIIVGNTYPLLDELHKNIREYCYVDNIIQYENAPKNLIQYYNKNRTDYDWMFSDTDYFIITHLTSDSKINPNEQLVFARFKDIEDNNSDYNSLPWINLNNNNVIDDKHNPYTFLLGDVSNP